MNKKQFFIIGLVVLFSLCGQQTWAQDKKIITIGIVHDGLANSDTFIKNLNIELQALLGSKHKIEIPANKRMGARWSADTAASYYHQLINDRDVDIVLGIGVLASSVIAQKKHFPKPVIILGIINPEIYHIGSLNQSSSGVPNLSYILFNQSIERDLDTFFRVYHYKNIGIVFFDEIIKLNPFSSASFKAVMEKNNTKHTPLPVNKGINDVLSRLKDVDALYIGHIGKFEAVEKARLIEELNNRRLPVFGFS